MGNTFLRALVCSLGVLTLVFAFISVSFFVGVGWAALVCLIITLVPLVYLLRVIVSSDDNA